MEGPCLSVCACSVLESSEDPTRHHRSLTLGYTVETGLHLDQTSPKSRRTSQSHPHRGDPRSPLLGPYIEVFQDDGNVHVDHYKEGHDEVAAKEYDAHSWIPTIPSDFRTWVLCIGITVWWPTVQHGKQEPIPTSRGGDLKKADNAIAKCLKIEHVINPSLFFDICKVGHPKYGKNEHD